MAQQQQYPALGNEWHEVQEKVFTRWCNTHLKKRNPPRELVMGSLTKGGLDDGIHMWELVTQISKEALPKPDRRGRMRIHYINNHDLVMKFVSSKIKLVGMGPEDIVNRNRNLILGYIWTLILRYQIGGEGNSARAELLKWLRSIGIKVNDLTTDWSDGKQICNLVNIIRPGLIAPSEVTTDAKKNVQKALDVSFEEFDIPKVLDAEDMAREDADELVNMTYLSYFRDKYNELISAALAGVLGPNPRESQAKKPFTFQVKTTNVKEPGQFETAAKDSTGKKFPVTVSKGLQTDVWDFTFVPPAEGTYNIDIIVGKKPVKNAPMVLHATTAPWAQIHDIPEAVATKPMTVKLGTGCGLKPHEIQFELLDQHNKPVPNVPATIKDAGNNHLDLQFTPPTAGDYKINVTYKDDGLPCKNSPYPITVKPKPQVLGFTGGRGVSYFLDNAVVGKPTTVPIDIIGLKPSDLVCAVGPADPSKPPLSNVTVSDKGNNQFEITFVPQHPGSHLFNLKADGQQVPGLPARFDVKPRPAITGFGGPKGLDYLLQDATATKPVNVPLETVNLTPEEVVVTVTDPNGQNLGPIKVTSTGPNGMNVHFVPLVQGPHKFNIVADGEQVAGLPRAFNVHPKPAVTGFGAKGLDYHLQDATATKPVNVILDVVNLRPEDLLVTVTDPKGNLLKPVSVTDKHDGTFNVHFIPLVPGGHKFNIVADGNPVPGLPKDFNVKPKPEITAFGPKGLDYYFQDATATKPVNVLLDTTNLTPEEVVVTVTDPKGQNIGPIKVTSTGPNSMNVNFTPMTAGPHRFNIIADGQQVKGLPKDFTVKPKPTVTAFGGPKGLDYLLSEAVATKPVNVPLDTVNLTPEEVVVTVTDPSGKQLQPVKVTSTGPNGMNVHFVPLVPGPHKFNIVADGDQVKGLPKAFEVKPKPTITGFGPKGLDYHLDKATATKPVNVTLDVINLSPNDLEITVTDPYGQSIRPVKVTENRDGTFNVNFIPLVQGPHTFNIIADGEQVKDLPKSFTVQPKPTVSGFDSFNLDNAVASKPVSIPVEIINLNPNDLQVTVTDPKGNVTKPNIKVLGPGKFDINFVPLTEGPHTFTMVADGEMAKDCPYKFNVQPKPSAKIIPPPSTAIATKPYTFKLDTINLKPEDVQVNAVGPNGPVEPVQVRDNHDGTFDVTFVPKTPGAYNIKAIADGSPVQGAPFTVQVQPRPAATYHGPKSITSPAGKPAYIDLDTINCKPNDLEVIVTDQFGSPVYLPIKIQELGPGQHKIELIPQEKGPLKVQIKADGEPIPGPPISFEVTDKPSAVYAGPRTFEAVAGKPCTVPLDVVNISPEDLKVSLKDPDTGASTPVKIIDNMDGTFGVNFVPKTPGNLILETLLDGAPIQGMPLKIHVQDQPSATYKGPKEGLKGIAKRPFVLPLDVVNCSPSELDFDIRGPDGRPVPYQISEAGPGQVALKFVPKDPGNIRITGTADGSPIDGFPLHINIEEPPWAKVIGPPQRYTKVGDPLMIKVDFVNLKPTDLDIKLPFNPKTKPTVKDNGDGTMTITVVPDSIGPFKMTVNLNDQPIEGCPLAIEVDPKTKWGDDLLNLLDTVQNENEKFSLVPYSDLSSVGTNQPVIFHCIPDTGYVSAATSMMFTATVVAQEGPHPVPLVKLTHQNDFEVRFVPQNRTTYTLDVQLSGNPIRNSPQTFTINALGAAFVENTGRNMKIGVQIPKDSAVSKQPFSFKIVYSDVPDPREISCKVIDPNGAELRPELSTRSNGQIDATVIPQTHGFHKAVPYYEGTVISGNMGFECSPEPTAKVIGAAERSDGVKGQDYTVKVGAINCTLSNFKFAVKGPTGSVVASFNLNPNGGDTGISTKFVAQKGGKANPNGVENGIFDVTFVPKEFGAHTLVGFLNGKPLTGCPVLIQVHPQSSTSHGTTVEVALASPKGGQPLPMGTQQARSSPRQPPVQFGGQPAQFGGQPAQFGGQPAQFGGGSSESPRSPHSPHSPHSPKSHSGSSRPHGKSSSGHKSSSKSHKSSTPRSGK